MHKERILTGKQAKMTPEEREVKKQQKLKERFKFEAKRMRGYELIYPCANAERAEKFEQMIKKSNEIWDEFTTGKHRKKIEKNPPPKIPPKKATPNVAADKTKIVVKPATHNSEA